MNFVDDRGQLRGTFYKLPYKSTRIRLYRNRGLSIQPSSLIQI